MRVLQHAFVFVFLQTAGGLLHYVAVSQGPLPFQWGPFTLVANPGFIFGLYSDASPFIRLVLGSLVMGPLSLIALYLYANLAPELRWLRWGMTMLAAGIVGNGMEKILFGFVVDYLSFDLPRIGFFIFNLNDVSQIVGLIIIVREVFIRQDVIWFPSPMRRSLIVYPQIQVPALFRILTGVFIGSLSQLILTVLIIFPEIPEERSSVLGVYLAVLFALMTALLSILGLLILREFLRCLGPVASLERYLNEGNAEVPLRFRRSHHFASLESSFNRFVEAIVKSTKS